jgi:hypothetical protein
VKRRVHSREHTALGSESRIPSFLVEMEISTIEFVEEVGVANVQLVWRDADNGSCVDQPKSYISLQLIEKKIKD